jgi:plastocyanin
MHARPRILVGAAIAVGASTALWAPALAAGPQAHAAAAVKTVTLKDISFKPATVKIAKGGSVRWVWKDGDTPHNVTFRKGGKHSRTQKSGKYTLRFGKAGTFSYHCTIHPGMDGKVVVR